MIRDQRRNFEDESFPKLLMQLDQLARPASPVPETSTLAAEPTKTSTLGAQTAPVKPAEPRLVPARTIKVGYGKPWLASESELDDYLQQLRDAWLREIQAGNRVQI